MIDLKSKPKVGASPLSFRLIGIGNAGVHLADRFIVESGREVDVLTANTDAHALSSSIALEKIFMGNRAARGLGAGGVPEVGAAAAEESMSEFTAAMEGRDVVILCAGLGGGTGSGALPLIASCAKLSGAWVIVFVTLPFAFEGRRVRQAKAALDEVSKYADVVVCFENDRMSELTRPLNGVGETFHAADETICHALSMLFQILTLPGRFCLTLADLRGLLAGREARCLLGVGKASGANRSNDAISKALKSPMLAKGKILGKSPRVLIYFAGSESLTISEIAAAMDEIQKHIDPDALLSIGVGFLTDTDDLTITILGCSEVRQESERSSPTEKTTQLPNRTTSTASVRRTSGKKIKDDALRQGTLPLGDAERGRFEKSEPTMVEGEDLDVPAFLRQNVKLK